MYRFTGDDRELIGNHVRKGEKFRGTKREREREDGDDKRLTNEHGRGEVNESYSRSRHGDWNSSRRGGDRRAGDGLMEGRDWSLQGFDEGREGSGSVEG